MRVRTGRDTVDEVGEWDVNRREAEEQGFRHISFFQAMMLRVFGPPELGDAGPLAGTKYDPALRRARDREKFEARRALKLERWEAYQRAQAEAEAEAEARGAR